MHHPVYPKLCTIPFGPQLFTIIILFSPKLFTVTIHLTQSYAPVHPPRQPERSYIIAHSWTLDVSSELSGYHYNQILSEISAGMAGTSGFANSSHTQDATGVVWRLGNLSIFI